MDNKKIGDKIIIQNKAGLSGILILEIIGVHYEDIGTSSNNLGEFKKLRVEFYKTDYVTQWISLYDDGDKDYMMLARMPHDDDSSFIAYECKIISNEDVSVDLVRYMGGK